MTEYDETNRGSLWANKKKREGRQDPDFTGDFTDGHGVKYFVDAWKRKPDANPEAPALKFKVKRKEKQPDPISTGRNNDMDDDPWR